MNVRIALNSAEAAAAVGLKPNTIVAAIKAGELKAKRSARDTREGKVGDGIGPYLIDVDDLREWFRGLPDA